MLSARRPHASTCGLATEVVILISVMGWTAFCVESALELSQLNNPQVSATGMCNIHTERERERERETES